MTAKLGATVGFATLGLVLGGAAPALAAPALTETTTVEADCTVSNAELRWGLKESFRNYISGSIANGEWTTENGAGYETPHFTWSAGEGRFAPDLSTGGLSFTGDVHFTGHDGLMRLDIANPEIVFTGTESADLVLDVGSADTAEATIEYERVSVAKVDLAGYESRGDTLTAVDAAVRLTSEGAAALNGAYGDYVAGGEMDPLTLEVPLAGCEVASSTSSPTPSNTTETPSSENGEETAAPQPQADEDSIPWLPIGIGAVALIAVGVTTGMLIAGGRKRPQDPASN